MLNLGPESQASRLGGSCMAIGKATAKLKIAIVIDALQMERLQITRESERKKNVITPHLQSFTRRFCTNVILTNHKGKKKKFQKKK